MKAKRTVVLSVLALGLLSACSSWNAMTASSTPDSSSGIVTAWNNPDQNPNQLNRVAECETLALNIGQEESPGAQTVQSPEAVRSAQAAYDNCIASGR
jgi:hypothetical protein